MADEKVYLRLGDKGQTTYVDQKNQISLSGPEVLAVDVNLVNGSKSILTALNNGHIKKATEEEFNAWKTIEKADNAPIKTLLQQAQEATPGAGDPTIALNSASNDNPDSKTPLTAGLTGNSGNAEGTKQNNDMAGILKKEGKAQGSQEDDDDDELSTSEMIDAIKEKRTAPKGTLDRLTKLSPEELKAAYDQYGK